MLACYQYLCLVKNHLISKKINSWAIDLLLNNTIKCYCNVAAGKRTSTLIIVSKFLTLQSKIYNIELHVKMDG